MFATFYQEHLKAWPGYIEVESMRFQYEMMMKDRMKVILLDRYIVCYVSKLEMM